MACGLVSTALVMVVIAIIVYVEMQVYYSLEEAMAAHPPQPPRKPLTDRDMKTVSKLLGLWLLIA